MRRFERQGRDRIQEALESLQERLFVGLDTDTAEQALRRLDNRDIVQPFRDTITALIQEWAQAGSDFGREQIEREVFGVKQGPTIDWELANEAAARWAIEHAGQLVAQINGTTRKRIRTELAAFVQNQEELPALIERLAPTFGRERAELIAVTEVTNAFAAANEIAWRESGVVEEKEWRTNNDEIVAECPICFPMHKERAPVGQDWEHPTRGAISLPGHPRCRCWSVPVPLGE